MNPNNDWNTTETKELIQAILALKDVQEVANFLRDLMTPQEIETFAARFQAASLLNEGKLSYREISKKTGMSTTTVTRINNWLERGMGGYKTALNRLSQGHHHHNTSH